ncbi:uncharacterized protein LOC130825275 [Amaranthus tricolor]|uniref:uncharacterized protein LOC130825275 n=1 Tax=Amaranthus tricolor TaxID=29722 RepID=UPI00258A9B8D|nr:uncharacterized protein LOC130825275 [Amaranthus tricolor]XP_057546398.1 uncharacterized protein LOC130825275 [Amaranthus tricolor]XP_057546399.1 uncharacterized protein LOC130825275 [Amaranthus tricolor]
MKETQTPRSKEIFNRRHKDSPSSKSFSEQPKKNQKIAKRNLNGEFASIYEDFPAEPAIESPILSTITDVSSDSNHNGESLDRSGSSVIAENQLIVLSEEASRLSDCTTTSKIATINAESVNLSFDSHKSFDLKGSVEVDVIVNLLKQARNEVVGSNGVSPSSMKLLDALVEATVRDLHTFPDRGDAIDAVLSNKLRIVVICFVVWMIGMTAIMICRSSTHNSSSLKFMPT